MQKEQGSCYFNWAERSAQTMNSHPCEGWLPLPNIDSMCTPVYARMCVKGELCGFQRGWSHCSLVTMVTRFSGPQGGKSEKVGVGGARRVQGIMRSVSCDKTIYIKTGMFWVFMATYKNKFEAFKKKKHPQSPQRADTSVCRGKRQELFMCLSGNTP